MLGLSFAILQPFYTWPLPAPKPLAVDLPKLPTPSHWLIRRFWGYVHNFIVKFSIWYCKRVDVDFDLQICPLPFGALLKWSDGTRLEEVMATKLARKAGLPVPLILCYGDHPNAPHAPVSILMTRIPGDILFKELWEWYNEAEKATIVSELKNYLDAMRCWKNPFWDTAQICSVMGTPIRIVRVPFHLIGPCKDETEFNEATMKYSHGSDEELEMARARKTDHDIVFTHGDFQPWNILVYDGHVSSIIDWEAFGWYPEYWEYTIAWQLRQPGDWWYEIVKTLSEGRYLDERIGDTAVRRLTTDSMGLLVPASSFYWHLLTYVKHYN